MRGGPTILSGWAVGLSAQATRVPERLLGERALPAPFAISGPLGPDDFGTHPVYGLCGLGGTFPSPISFCEWDGVRLLPLDPYIPFYPPRRGGMGLGSRAVGVG